MNVSNADNNIASLQKQITVLQGQLPSMTLSVFCILNISQDNWTSGLGRRKADLLSVTHWT